GAGAELTLRANRAAFERWAIVPRVLRDVSVRDLSIELFGDRLPAPILLAPVGVLEMAHREADAAVARAAARAEIPMIVSSQASCPIETCAAVGSGPRWFQLYWNGVDAVMESFVRRSEACHCRAIVLTVDTTMLAWRPPGGLLTSLRSGQPRAAVRRFAATFPRPLLSWEDIPRLRELTKLPLLLKGILHPDDARRAVDAGADGVIVSNHGGRQVDGAIATLDALPDIVEAVGGRVPVLLDSGIRTGADVFKALALGARAVCIGRPYVYGLALAGEAGVLEVLRNLLADFDLTVGLAGCRGVEEITGARLQRTPFQVS